ncbi:hypothetical protein Pan97_00280 [Bremerella volcania]|uniref:Uncharacterized protein n=1 Tax=Bremerella volcania TaxID=2527984 RepID=A0A518C1F1_9BACT|nr:hypothetical protein [Bremerella volcania]QDU73061.1 hypothetical protein Pan97_00280 [Bremerella volcania]
MAQTYLLTTPDGEEVHVESSQAGETITTASGKTVEVPTLRELKKLPLVEKEEAPVRRDWSVGQSILFVVGLLLLIGCSVSSVFLYRITPLESLDKAREVPIELIEGDVEQWTMKDTLSFWAFASSGHALSDMRGNASGDRYVLGVYESRQTFLTLSVAGVVLGLILMGSAFALPGTRRS